ncbi:hypothetical protein WA026_008231 [Henosepilachna vigintioctopunctata]|uniref:Uncharacterized protein n=1 Tax=Henosepilachna vigintioctopunctata TaxID=420089 RepID=A0AAW1TIR2_9CUCU
MIFSIVTTLLDSFHSHILISDRLVNDVHTDDSMNRWPTLRPQQWAPGAVTCRRAQPDYNAAAPAEAPPPCHYEGGGRGGAAHASLSAQPSHCVLARALVIGTVIVVFRRNEI